MKRILHFVPGFYMGGIESFLMGMLRSLQGEKIKFDFIVDTKESLPEFDEIRSYGGRVFQMGRYLNAPLKYNNALTQIFNNHADEYLAVHCHSVIRAFPVLWAARKYGVKKRILHSHTDSLKGSMQAYLMPFISLLTNPLASEFWACSKAAGKFFFGNRKFELVNNAINTKSFAFDPTDRNRVRGELNISPSSLVIGHTGRFTYQKNHEFMIKVFFEFHQRINDSYFLLVGAGPLESRMRSLCQELGIEDCVKFVGSHYKVYPFLSAMDVFFLPSHFEGFCISLLEAQANGLPCVVSSVIPDEVRLTPCITIVDLEKGVPTWCSVLLSTSSDGRFSSDKCMEVIRSSGFDAAEQAFNVLKKYSSL